MDLTKLIAAIANERVVVAGSLPPYGADLDLLVRRDEAESLAAGLTDAGFERRGRVWARFAGCGVDVVELVPAEGLHLPAAELEALFSEAAPLEPLGRVCRPAPHHTLLILARRAMREGRTLQAKRLDRIAAELGEDAAAFEVATERALAWGATGSLPALERAFRSGWAIPVATRRRAVAQELSRSRRPLAACVGSWRAVLRRPRRGSVVAFSGLDGSGKSTQAEHLAEALRRLGPAAELAWTSVAFHPPWLGRLVRAAKRPMAAAAARAGLKPEADLDAGAPRGSEDLVKTIRRRSSVLTFAWSTTVTTLLCWQILTRIWPPLLRGRVVVCDRYLLDAWTHLSFQYGEERGFRVQLGLLRWLFPRPGVAYLLEVSAEAAAARKPEYTAVQNARRAAIYREKAATLGVRILDGERPMDELCAEIAREVWAELARVSSGAGSAADPNPGRSRQS